MNLFERIINQKNKGDSSNYDKVFLDMRSMKHSPVDKFSFDNYEISWTYFRPIEFYNDIILDNDNTIFFYLRNHNLTFEAVFCGYSDDQNKPIIQRVVVISSIYVFGQTFPGLDGFEIRPVRIGSNNPFPNSPIKKLNYHFRTTLEKYKRKAKPIYEMTDFYKGKQGWQKIVEKDKALKEHAKKTSR